ncbi:hypothetical protein E2C01_049551 [Portunus trituberculatus]|uniref:Uncharacterized protein n=1 Tax=Portunus trituberculatus TaxID=210409 RepID=A0A5B7GEP7_PORTR|nr:hypothetical protein [Portunus trituberculatus]
MIPEHQDFKAQRHHVLGSKVAGYHASKALGRQGSNKSP